MTTAALWIPRKGRPSVRMPYAEDNRTWLWAVVAQKPTWNRENRAWDFPRNCISSVLEALLGRYDEVVVASWGKISARTKCDTRCLAANPMSECKCSCGGASHGAKKIAGRLVGDTTIITTEDEWQLNRRVYRAIEAR